MEQEQKQQDQEKQPEQLKVVEETKKNTIPTRLGSLVILLVATLAGAGVWWYAGSYTPPEAVDVSGVVEQMQERREVKNEFPSYYKIKTDGVYYRGKLMEGADSKSFEIISEITGGASNPFYSKDSSKLFFLSQEVLGADIDTIEIFDEFYICPNYLKDRNNIYWRGNRIVGADCSTFERLSDYYSKDAYNLYFKTRVVPDVDVQSVYLLGERCAIIEGNKEEYELVRDKNSIYCKGVKLDVEDPTSFIPFSSYRCKWSDGSCYARDKEHVYKGTVMLKKGEDSDNADNWYVKWEILSEDEEEYELLYK